MLTSRILRVARCSSSLVARISPKVPGGEQHPPGGPRTECLRSFGTSLSHAGEAQVSTPFSTPPTEVTEARMALKTVTVMFGDESQSAYPHVWLRENCQCHECFNQDAIARLFLLEDLDLDMRPKNVRVEDGCLRVEWEDGHIGLFSGPWLHQRAFTQEARAKHRAQYMLSRVRWGPGFQVPLIDYQSAMEDDRVLLDWLTLLERFGVVLITNAPQKVGAINDFINNIGFIKPTHYGTDYELVTHVTPNNLAYTGAKLGLHTDLPYYEYPPGTTWLHCLRQHEGKGGDNDLADGLNVADVLRERHPDLFQVLVDTPVYFQDKGFHHYDFDKITRVPVVMLDERGHVRRIHMSSQARDPIMDLDTDGVLQFYKALKTFNSILMELSISVKTKPGDILVLDNTRVLHGRQAFEPDVSSGPRHIHNAYIDWDELRSKRRVLQRRFKVDLA